MLDLHVHLRGTITPARAKALAIKNSRTIDADAHAWHDFTSFLKAYDEVASVITDAADLEAVAFDYLTRTAEVGGKYVEFMLSPPDLLRNGVAFDDQLAALSSARVRALEEHGIDCRLIATAVRHLGPDAAISAARIAVARKDEILVGFGLTGDERCFEPADFREAFRIARTEGLLATAHAGEHRGPNSVLVAIEELGLSRVGHGVRVAESEAAVSQLARERIPFEVCLGSNLSLGLYRSIEMHPIRELWRRGCIITLGTDDPSFFATDIANEYRLAVDAVGASDSKSTIVRNSVNSAFCDDECKNRLLLAIERSSV